MNRPDWAPKDVDLEKASAARLYDYFLGGSYNFEVDRQLAEQVLVATPTVPDVLRANRAFLRRAVTYLVEQGITQFLDLGSGIPTAGNVHEVAQKLNPDVRVMYVDNEPVAVAHSELILENNPNADAIEADLREPEVILNHPKTRALLDFTRPIGLLTVAVFHFVPDDADPPALMRQYREALPAGSYLALSHAAMENNDQLGDAIELYKQSQNPAFLRTYEQIFELFDGFEPVEPGVVYTELWRPDSPEDVGEHPEESAFYVGVARRR